MDLVKYMAGMRVVDGSCTWVRGGRLLLIVLLMPLHGPVVAQHHFPQCLAKVSQAGDVAVVGDVLRQGWKERYRERNRDREGQVEREKNRERDRKKKRDKAHFIIALSQYLHCTQS